MTKTERPSVSLSLTVKDSNAALDFYHRAFGAVELVRMPTPAGNIAHAEFKIGDTQICMSDEDPEWHAVAMPEGGRASCLFAIAVEDWDRVFAVNVHGLASEPLPGVANLGKRPTVGGLKTLLEVHLFDFQGDVYGRRICVEFVEKIRPEQKFDGFDALKAQIHKDCLVARDILGVAT